MNMFAALVIRSLDTFSLPSTMVGIKAGLFVAESNPFAQRRKTPMDSISLQCLL